MFGSIIHCQWPTFVGWSSNQTVRRRRSIPLIFRHVCAISCVLLSSSSNTMMKIMTTTTTNTSTTAQAMSTTDTTTTTGRQQPRSRVIHALYAGHPDRWFEYQPYFQRSFQNAGLDNVRLSNEYPAEDPSLFDYIIHSPNGPLQDFSPFTNIKAVLNLRAGVEGVIDNPTLKVPLCRMVDPGLKQGMVEYIVAHTFRHHLQTDELWRYKNRRNSFKQKAAILGRSALAKEKTVGILGLGELGMACATALVPFQFHVLGWTRRPKENPPPPGIECCTGSQGLDQILSQADILVLLLPNTLETENIINEETLQKCKTGVAIINGGRGNLIDDNALLDALDKGIVSGATLDVFRTEPLPSDHGYWDDPRVLITPHIAAKTGAATAAPVIAENIRRCENGESLLYVVDRESGY